MLGLTTNHPQWSWLENRLTLGFANTLTFFKKWRVHVFLDHRGGNYMWNAGNYIRNKYDQNAWAVVNPDADPNDALYPESGASLCLSMRRRATQTRSGAAHRSPRSAGDGCASRASI